jgi:hypothetical protein
MMIDKYQHIRAVLTAVLLAVTPGLCLATDYAAAIFAGQLTNEKFQEAVQPGADFADAALVVASASWTIAHWFSDRLSCELEGQVGRYFGDQEHWEINLPIVGLRWHRFPWDDYLASSLAWGIGPSYATKVPAVELENNESSSKWLVYWFAELTVAPPAARWEVLFRLHHRSDAFGAVAEDGGSNAVGAGLRYRF